MLKHQIADNPRLKVSLGVVLSVSAVCLLSWWVSTAHLTERSMWIDEAQTLTTSSSTSVFNVVQILALDVHPPVYFLWVRFWLSFIGNDALFVLRLSSVIPGVLAVAICYRLTWEWFKNHTAALGAAAFLATSGLFVSYTRDLRMYPLMMMMTLFNWWMLTRYLQGKTWARWSYAASLVLLAYTFYFAAFMVIAQWIVVLVFFRTRVWKLLKACGLLSLAFVPWLPILVAQMHEARAQANDPNAPLIGKFLGTIPTSFGAIWQFVQTYTAHQPAYILLLLTIAVLLGLQNAMFRRWTIAAMLWLFLTITLFFTVNLAFPIYGIRYVLSVLPALAVLAGSSLAVLPNATVRTGILGLIVVTGLLSQTDGFIPPQSAPHHELLSTVAAHYLPNDRLWYDINQGALGSAFSDDVKYHLRQDAPILNPDLWVWNAPQEYLDVQQNPRVWLVRPYWVTPPPGTQAPLENGRAITEEQVFGGYAVKLYEAPPLQETPVGLGGFFNLLISPQDVIGYEAGQPVAIKSWWRGLQPVTLDYSVSLMLTLARNTTAISQQDSSLLINAKPTSQLAAAQSYTYQGLTFTLPATLAAGRYEIWMTVYYYGDLKRLPVTPSPDFPTNSAQSTVRVATITIR